MNFLLTIGLLLIVGYTAGWLLNKLGLPKIVGYILTGIAFSPNTIDLVDSNLLESTDSLMDVCLAFIAFEVGGAIKWLKIKEHRKEIVSITVFASVLPFVLITLGILAFGYLFPSIVPLDPTTLVLLALLLGALASPTEPAATLAVMHEYKAKGKVTDTILGVAALDDVLGILLFSLTVAGIFMFTGGETGLFGNPALNSLYEVGVAVLIGSVLGLLIDPIARMLKVEGEGQWVIVIFSLIIFCLGLSQALHVDVLLSSMTMGIVVVNRSKQQGVIFRIIERYTEDLIFLFFFVLSGLHLDVATLSSAISLIVIFVVLRAIGKFVGTHVGSKMVGADLAIQKYTAGGLLPQGGIVIGLVLSIHEMEAFKNLSEILLTTVMGTMVIHELLGPIAAKYALRKAGEIGSPPVENK